MVYNSVHLSGFVYGDARLAGARTIRLVFRKEMGVGNSTIALRSARIRRGGCVALSRGRLITQPFHCLLVGGPTSAVYSGVSRTCPSLFGCVGRNGGTRLRVTNHLSTSAAKLILVASSNH